MIPNFIFFTFLKRKSIFLRQNYKLYKDNLLDGSSFTGRKFRIVASGAVPVIQKVTADSENMSRSRNGVYRHRK